MCLLYIAIIQTEEEGVYIYIILFIIEKEEEEGVVEVGGRMPTVRSTVGPNNTTTLRAHYSSY